MEFICSSSQRYVGETVLYRRLHFIRMRCPDGYFRSTVLSEEIGFDFS